MALIYVVEDDDNIRNLVLYALKNNDFQGRGFESGEEFFDSLEKDLPDLIILDIMLPGTDGYEILDSIRKMDRTKDIPVIMLTAKTSEFDKVRGLDSGADDYITKPFGVMEMISRVKALLRRVGEKPNQRVLKSHEISLYPKERKVFIRDEEIELTFKEFELLNYLIINKNIGLNREQILLNIWGFDFQGETRTVDVHIGTLRQKLKDQGQHIKTLRNIGYKLEE